MDKGSFLRKIICLWGYHDWEKFKTGPSAGGVPVFLAGGSMLLSGMYASTSLLGILEHPVAPAITLLAILIFLLSAAIFNHVSTHNLYSFDGICVYCHKTTRRASDLEKRKQEAEEYRQILSELATETFNKESDSKNVDE